MRQLERIGESATEYETLWIYTEGATEERFKLYQYPEVNI